jgi:hypothetical protein
VTKGKIKDRKPIRLIGSDKVSVRKFEMENLFRGVIPLFIFLNIFLNNKKYEITTKKKNFGLSSDIFSENSNYMDRLTGLYDKSISIRHSMQQRALQIQCVDIYCLLHLRN